MIVPDLPSQPGSYLLGLKLSRPRMLKIGKLCKHRFPAGLYVYAGSAFGPGGIRARLGRHLRGDGRVRWHVDYLRAVARPVWVAWQVGERTEHDWSSRLLESGVGEVLVPGFGSSDCRCRSHLLRLVTTSEVGQVLESSLRPQSGIVCLQVSMSVHPPVSGETGP